MAMGRKYHSNWSPLGTSAGNQSKSTVVTLKQESTLIGQKAGFLSSDEFMGFTTLLRHAFIKCGFIWSNNKIVITNNLYQTSSMHQRYSFKN